MRPLVSIVTPSLNQGRFIDETIRSVLDQGYEPIEYIVRDGGSRDETHAILERHRDRIQCVIEPDGGQADAINRGLRAARGEIVAWLSADDYYVPGAVAAAVEYLEGHPACAMVYGRGQFVDASGNLLGPYPTAPVSRLRSGCVVCQPAAFLRRAAVADVGFLDPRLRFCMDYDLWLRLAACREIAYIGVDFARYRLHHDAKSVRDRLPFMREVVHMTHVRIGRAPLFYLYAYANLLVEGRFARGRSLPSPVRRAAALAVAAALATRYHRGLRWSEIREALDFERGPWPDPAALPGAHDGPRPDPR